MFGLSSLIKNSSTFKIGNKTLSAIGIIYLFLNLFIGQKGFSSGHGMMEAQIKGRIKVSEKL